MSRSIEEPTTSEVPSKDQTKTLDPLEEITKKMYWARTRAWGYTFLLCGVVTIVVLRLFELSLRLWAANMSSFSSTPLPAGPSGWDWVMFSANIWPLLLCATKMLRAYHNLDNLRCNKTALLVKQQFTHD